MNLGIQGKRALIFGGSRGVGRAVTMALASEGVNVAVCASKEWAAQKVASEAVAAGGIGAAGYGINAWDGPSTVDLISRIVKDFGTIDILFGIARRARLPDRNELSMREWHFHFDYSFLRFKTATEAVLSGMRHRQWGRILWMIPFANRGTGIAGRMHSVMDTALSAWLRSLAAEVFGDGVTLNILRSTPVSRGPRDEPSLRMHQARSASNPTIGDEAPSVPQVASVATFLLSDVASGVCGRTIRLGGRKHDSA